MITKRLKLLTIGSNGGFGKYISKELNTFMFTRKTKLSQLKKEYDVVIHCANNPSFSINYENVYDFFYDNFLLTTNLLKLKFKHFIFISSVGIYPSSSKGKVDENLNFLIKNRSYYEFLKVISEQHIKKNTKKFSILRTGGLLDSSSRENSIQKIIKNRNIKLNLSGDSTFNYILYEDLLSFIKIIIEKKKYGIFNVSASKNVKLSKLKEKLNSNNIKFGDYKYITPKIDNSKARKEYLKLKFTTEKNIERYLKIQKNN